MNKPDKPAIGYKWRGNSSKHAFVVVHMDLGPSSALKELRATLALLASLTCAHASSVTWRSLVNHGEPLDQWTTRMTTSQDFPTQRLEDMDFSRI